MRNVLILFTKTQFMYFKYQQDSWHTVHKKVIERGYDTFSMRDIPVVCAQGDKKWRDANYIVADCRKCGKLAWKINRVIKRALLKCMKELNNEAKSK